MIPDMSAWAKMPPVEKAVAVGVVLGVLGIGAVLEHGNGKAAEVTTSAMEDAPEPEEEVAGTWRELTVWWDGLSAIRRSGLCGYYATDPYGLVAEASVALASNRGISKPSDIGTIKSFVGAVCENLAKGYD